MVITTYTALKATNVRFNSMEFGEEYNFFNLFEFFQGDISMEQMEKQFDGNICRCTGYRFIFIFNSFFCAQHKIDKIILFKSLRPILDASKSFAKDSDIEDLVSGKIKCGGYDTSVDPKFPEFLVNYKSNPTEFQSSNLKWIRPLNLTEVFAALESNPGNLSLFSYVPSWTSSLAAC